MARKTYRASELRAGLTVFVSCFDWASRAGVGRVEVHLIGSERDRMPAPGEIFPYRVRPSCARAGLIDGGAVFFKTRRAAQRDADQRAREFNAARRRNGVAQ
jgi:hypothetical protein